MKKIFFISLLFFLLNNTAFGKELKIECTVKKIDEKGNFYKIGDKTIWTYDLSSKKYIVTDDFIRHYHLAKIKDKYFLQYLQIFRYTGEFIQKSIDIPEDIIKDLLNIDYENQNLETFNKIFFLVNDFFLKNKISKQNVYWQEYIMDCIKAQKRF
tara:strand:- start:351 stop:815 length:465 start_codon:yes stop_codon:yes gene_type:complete